jgi:diguanylate cyclase (GGDEF)-like protein
MGRTILIVDDDRALRRLLAAQLTTRGHRVLEAGTAREGQRLMNGHAVDLAIVDGLLPDTRGVQWIAHLREAGLGLPIVFISAYWRDLSTYRRLTQELGVLLVLYKPLDAERLAEKVESLLPGQARGGALRAREESVLDIDIELENDSQDFLSDDAQTQPAIADLMREYSAALPGRISDLRDALVAARSDGELLHDAILRAHRLRGTAGTYGFAAVSAGAGEIEDLLLEVQVEGSPWTAAWPRLERALQNVRLSATAGAARPVEDPEIPDLPETEVVLVVDQDAEFTLAVGHYVREQMMQVALASGSSEALDKARSAQLSAAIIDYDLPEGDALTLVAALRSMRKDLAISLVARTDSLESRLAALRAGATLFFVKSQLAREFPVHLRQMLSGALGTRGRVLAVSQDRMLLDPAVDALIADGIDARGLEHPGELFDSLARLRPDLLIIDELSLPVTLSELLAALSLTPVLSDLPVLVLSDRASALHVAGRAAILGRGAGVEAIVTAARVRLLEARLWQQRMGVDTLTSLPSRSAFLTTLDARLSESQRTGRTLTLALLDVKRMGELNQRFGPSTGDAILTRAAQLLRDHMRSEDVRARWARDEFVLLLPGETVDSARRAVARVLDDLADLRIPLPSGDVLSVECGVGMASYPADGLTSSALVFAAETRLKDASTW